MSVLIRDFHMRGLVSSSTAPDHRPISILGEREVCIIIRSRDSIIECQRELS